MPYLRILLTYGIWYRWLCHVIRWKRDKFRGSILKLEMHFYMNLHQDWSRPETPKSVSLHKQLFVQVKYLCEERQHTYFQVKPIHKVFLSQNINVYTGEVLMGSNLHFLIILTQIQLFDQNFDTHVEIDGALIRKWNFTWSYLPMCTYTAVLLS